MPLQRQHQPKAGVDEKALPIVSQVLKWKAVDVMAHIRSLNPLFGEYAKAFESAGVDGFMLVYEVDDEWLASHIPDS